MSQLIQSTVCEPNQRRGKPRKSNLIFSLKNSLCDDPIAILLGLIEQYSHCLDLVLCMLSLYCARPKLALQLLLPAVQINNSQIKSGQSRQYSRTENYFTAQQCINIYSDKTLEVEGFTNNKLTFPATGSGQVQIRALLADTWSAILETILSRWRWLVAIQNFRSKPNNK